jgi:uncharacterized membrane protein
VDAHLRDWLHLVLRWFHIIIGIMWIGNSLFFMWLDKSFQNDELWMVHGGFFYRVEKKKPVPGELPETLHWFKWEATLTWVSGFSLLVVLYYFGGLMLDPNTAKISHGAAVHIGLGTLAGGWLFYDLLWRSPIGKSNLAGSVISLAALIAVAWGLSQIFSGRAAFIHVGALMGTCMVLNVWFHIMPAQKRMLADLKAGKPADFSRGDQAKKRSVHNSYMTFPVIYTMLSNHFSTHYGFDRKWIVLGVVMLAGALVRHAMIKATRRTAMLVPAAFAALIFLMVWTRPHAETSEVTETPPPAAHVQAEPIPDTTANIRGTVKFAGTAPARKKLTMLAECAALRKAPAEDDDVVVEPDGALAGAVVWLSKGWEKWQIPPAPANEVVIDQKGCLYGPHVAALRAGQTLAIVNSDPVLHNVHAWSTTEKTLFNAAMPVTGMRITKHFDVPQLFVRMGCDVHPWMRARVAVIPHPWFAVTDDKGAFELRGVPPGDYTIEAAHPVLGKTSRAITVSGDATADFSLGGS